MSKTFLLFILLGLLLPQLHTKLIVGDNFVNERHVKRGGVPAKDIDENGEGVLDFWDFDPSTGEKAARKTTGPVRRVKSEEELNKIIYRLVDELSGIIDNKESNSRHLSVNDSEDGFEEEGEQDSFPTEEENFEEYEENEENEEDEEDDEESLGGEEFEIGENVEFEEENEEDEDNTGALPEEEEDDSDDWDEEELEEWEDDSDDSDEWEEEEWEEEEWEEEEDDSDDWEEEEWEDDTDDTDFDDSGDDDYTPQEALASLGVYVRYGMDMQDFQETNGRRQFIDGLSNLLLIRPNTIQIQRIREGSVIIEFEIIVPKEDGTTQEDANAQIKDIADELDYAIADIFEGVQVLDYQKNIYTSEPQKVNGDDGANAAVGVIAGLCAVVVVVMLYFICKQKKQFTSELAKQKAYHPSIPDSEVNLDLENHVNEVYNGAQRGEDDSVNMYKIN